MLCLAIAGAALHEVGRPWDALEAHRVKSGGGTWLGNSVPEGAVLGLRARCSNQLGTGWLSCSLVVWGWTDQCHLPCNSLFKGQTLFSTGKSHAEVLTTLRSSLCGWRVEKALGNTVIQELQLCLQISRRCFVGLFLCCWSEITLMYLCEKYRRERVGKSLLSLPLPKIPMHHVHNDL